MPSRWDSDITFDEEFYCGNTGHTCKGLMDGNDYILDMTELGLICPTR